MPSAYGRAKESLCKGGCGKTVRETVDDCGTCRKCLSAHDPNDPRLKTKRKPDSLVPPVLIKSRAEAKQGLTTAEDELLAAVERSHIIIEDLSGVQVQMMQEQVRKQLDGRPLPIGEMHEINIDLVSEAERLVAGAEPLHEPQEERRVRPPRKRPAAKP